MYFDKASNLYTVCDRGFLICKLTDWLFRRRRLTEKPTDCSGDADRLIHCSETDWLFVRRRLSGWLFRSRRLTDWLIRRRRLTYWLFRRRSLTDWLFRRRPNYEQRGLDPGGPGGEAAGGGGCCQQGARHLPAQARDQPSLQVRNSRDIPYTVYCTV